MVQVGVDDNPEGPLVGGGVTSYDCEPGQLLGDCDRVALHRLVAAGPVSVRVSGDGSAQLTATVAEVRVRDGRQLRVFDVDLAVTAGNLTLRQNCVCTFTGSDGTTYTQSKFVKQWSGATASGTIGVFEVAPDRPPRPTRASTGSAPPRRSESGRDGAPGTFVVLFEHPQTLRLVEHMPVEDPRHDRAQRRLHPPEAGLLCRLPVARR